MKGTQLGEFEELVLLLTGVLYPDAYGVSIARELENQTGRKAAIGAIHSALVRLEEKGFLKSELQSGGGKRGGRPKKIFSITAAGKTAIAKSKELRNSLWDQIPELALKGLNYSYVIR